MKKVKLFIGAALMSLVMTTGLTGCKGEEPKHEHTFSEKWSSDETKHWHDATCGHDVKSGEAAHTWGNWSVTKAATCSMQGEEVRKCTVCQREEKRSTAIDPSKHSFAEAWSNDETHHWHASTCGHDVKDGYAEHTWGAWKETKEATCTTQGEEERECSVCYRKETRKTPTTEHHYSKDWSYDATNHWHECECGDKADVEAHKGGTAYCQKKAICSVCGQEYGDFDANSHLDENSDGICDLCEIVINTIEMKKDYYIDINAKKSYVYNITLEKGIYCFDGYGPADGVLKIVKNDTIFEQWDADEVFDFSVTEAEAGAYQLLVENNGTSKETFNIAMHKHTFNNVGDCTYCEEFFGIITEPGTVAKMSFDVYGKCYVYLNDIEAGDYVADIQGIDPIDLDVKVYTSDDKVNPISTTTEFTLTSDVATTIVVDLLDNEPGSYTIAVYKDRYEELKNGLEISHNIDDKDRINFIVEEDGVYCLSPSTGNLAITVCDEAELQYYTPTKQYVYLMSDNLYYFTYVAGAKGTTTLTLELVDDKSDALLSNEGFTRLYAGEQTYICAALVDETGYYQVTSNNANVNVGILNNYPETGNYYFLSNDVFAIIEIYASAAANATIKFTLVPNVSADAFTNEGFTQSYTASETYYKSVKPEATGYYTIDNGPCISVSIVNNSPVVDGRYFLDAEQYYLLKIECNSTETEYFKLVGTSDKTENVMGENGYTYLAKTGTTYLYLQVLVEEEGEYTLILSGVTGEIYGDGVTSKGSDVYDISADSVILIKVTSTLNGLKTVKLEASK